MLLDNEIGRAGEYLVCFNLNAKGYVCFMAEKGVPYDAVLDIKGKLLKIEIKTTLCSRDPLQRKYKIPMYYFRLRRGKYSRKTYSNGDVDLFAFASLEDGIVGYLSAKKIKQSMVFRDKKYEGQYYNEKFNTEFNKKYAEKIKAIKSLRKTHVPYKIIQYLCDMSNKEMDYYIRKKRDIKKIKNKEGTYLENLTIEKALYDIGIII